MRWFTLILGTLLILGGGLLGVVRLDVNNKHANTMQKDLDAAGKITAMLGKNHKLVKRVESYKGLPGRVKTGGVLMVVSAVFALALLIMAFAKKSQLVLFGTIGLLALLAATVVINPAYETGLTSAASARVAALIVCAALGLGGLLTLASDRLRLSKEAKLAAI